MILPDMTCQQMLDVFKQDEDLIFEENKRFIRSGGFNAARAKGAKFPMQILHAWTSPVTHQKYMLLNSILDKKDAYKKYSGICCTAIVETSSGTELVTQSDLPMTDGTTIEGIMCYLPHVFIRYKERLNLSYPKEDILRYFIKRNHFGIIQEKYRRSKDNTTDIMITVHDGAIFGSRDEEDERRIFIRTFVANATMEEGYKARFNKNFDDCVADNINALIETGHTSDALRMAAFTKTRTDGMPFLKEIITK